MTSATHMLKSWPEYFEAVVTGGRNFEVRKHDRDFKVGDTLVLQEWDVNTGEYTGRQINKRVVYILEVPSEPLFGLNRGYCVLGLGEIDGCLVRSMTPREIAEKMIEIRRDPLSDQEDLCAFVDEHFDDIVTALWEPDEPEQQD